MKIFEPEDFLETLDRMIELNTELLEVSEDEDTNDEIAEDLARLRDLHYRIRLQFDIETVTWN